MTLIPQDEITAYASSPDEAKFLTELLANHEKSKQAQEGRDLEEESKLVAQAIAEAHDA